jgi:hypothetical protein
MPLGRKLISTPSRGTSVHPSHLPAPLVAPASQARPPNEEVTPSSIPRSDLARSRDSHHPSPRVRLRHPDRPPTTRSCKPYTANDHGADRRQLCRRPLLESGPRHVTITRLRVLATDAVWPLWLGIGATSAVFDRFDGVGCPFHKLTGLDCPACGGTRALSSLLHGGLVNALHYNVMAVVLGAILVALAVLRHLGWTLPNSITASAVKCHRGAAALTVMVAWAILRNLPTFAWFNTGWATR